MQKQRQNKEGQGNRHRTLILRLISEAKLPNSVCTKRWVLNYF